MDDLDRTQVEQLLKLTKENNKILRSMRRNAWLGGIFKLVFWVLVFVVLPFWVYTTYLAPVMASMMGMMQQLQQVQGTGAQMQAQFGDLTEALNGLKAQFPQFFPQ
jgi:hypothetical protein